MIEGNLPISLEKLCFMKLFIDSAFLKRNFTSNVLADITP